MGKCEKSAGKKNVWKIAKSFMAETIRIIRLYRVIAHEVPRKLLKGKNGLKIEHIMFGSLKFKDDENWLKIYQ